MLSFEDVYLVTMQQGLDYVRHPVPLSDAASFFDCSDEVHETCQSVSCRYGPEQLPEEIAGSGEKYMKICCDSTAEDCCPTMYPWLGNPMGQ